MGFGSPRGLDTFLAGKQALMMNFKLLRNKTNVTFWYCKKWHNSVLFVLLQLKYLQTDSCKNMHKNNRARLQLVFQNPLGKWILWLYCKLLKSWSFNRYADTTWTVTVLETAALINLSVPIMPMTNPLIWMMFTSQSTLHSNCASSVISILSSKSVINICKSSS